MLSRIKEKNRKVEMCLMMCVMHCLIKTSKLLIDDVSCNVEKMIYFFDVVSTLCTQMLGYISSCHNNRALIGLTSFGKPVDCCFD